MNLPRTRQTTSSDFRFCGLLPFADFCLFLSAVRLLRRLFGHGDRP